MRVSLDWLAEWIDLPEPASLEERLTLGGLEIEDVLRAGPDLSAVVVGHVLERSQHPDADRLSVCRVDLGGGEAAQIVCGAPNVAAGQRVAVARPGTVLPDGTKLKRSKIRGVVSEGMICSERELGVGDAHEGILVLDPAAPVGVPLPEVLRSGDIVLDFEITPNRGDWASMLGMAREVRAHFGGELRMPPCDVTEAGAPAAGDVAVQVDDAEGCPHYVARVVRGLDPTRPSPEWLRRKLEAAGMRPLGVIVDVTNLVLLEFGQPLHAFDLSTLRGSCIRVRAAHEGEKILTLDGQTRSLEVGDLVVADAERAVAIAGIMGGAETEVRDSTRDVLIESARFAPGRVRRTARRLGLHSEASYRFERGTDPAGVERAADRAARLLAELAGGRVAPGRVEARGVEPERAAMVEFSVARCNRLLGTSLSTSDVIALLRRAEIEARDRGDGRLVCSVPSYRADVAIAEDLAEEVARLHGYDQIPATLPVVQIHEVSRPPQRVLEERVRDVLHTLGLVELIHYPSVTPEELAALRWPEGDPHLDPLEIENPMVQRDRLLRTTLLPGLLRTAARNLARQVDRVRVFEVGAIFQRGGAHDLPREPLTVAALLTRGDLRGLWDPRELPPLFFEARGCVERLIAELRAPLELHPSADVPYLHPGACLEIRHSGRTIGALGELHPETAQAFELDVPVAALELDLSPLVDAPAAAPVALAVSPYPAVRRDVAVLLDRTQPAGAVLEAVRQVSGPYLVRVELFDRFEGRGIPTGKVSLAFRMIFQRPDRTLTEKEVVKATEKVRNMLTRRFGGELR